MYANFFVATHILLNIDTVYYDGPLGDSGVEPGLWAGGPSPDGSAKKS